VAGARPALEENLPVSLPLWDCGGRVKGPSGAATLGTARTLRQSEKEARQLLDLSPLHITLLGPDGVRLYTNWASLDYYGITLEEWKNADLWQVLYPQDAEIVAMDRPRLRTIYGACHQSDQIDARTCWALANSREGQLGHIRPGMTPGVYLASRPDVRFSGETPDVQRSLNRVRLASWYPVRVFPPIARDDHTRRTRSTISR